MNTQINDLEEKYFYGRKLIGKVCAVFPFGCFIELNEDKNVKVLLEIFYFKEKGNYPEIESIVTVYVLGIGTQDKIIRVTENLSDITK